jgi:hypothetical protein
LPDGGKEFDFEHNKLMMLMMTSRERGSKVIVDGNGYNY